MKRYETIVILDPDLPEDQRRPVFDRIGEIIPQMGGELVKLEEWGVRKLAYPIKKKPRGHYSLVDFSGEGSLVAELERFFRIDDRIMKYMTVLYDPEADLAAQKKAEKAKAKKEGKTAAPEGNAEAAPEATAETTPTEAAEDAAQKEE